MIFPLKKMQKFKRTKTQMTALVELNLSRLKLSRTAIKKDD